MDRPAPADRALAVLRAARTGARSTTGALQTLPDATLMGVAATSIGVGAGFYLARAPRIAVATGIAPAFVMAAAILLRPVRPIRPLRPVRHAEVHTR
jgi:hypothetical protein